MKAAQLVLIAALLAPLPAGAQSAAPAGAGSCSGCHAPARVGSGLASINGLDAGEIVAAMQDYRSGRRPATVMDRIAKGFTDDEVEAIAAWLSRQPP